MTSLTLNGVTVKFPFTPYECQKDFMTKVLECLQKKVNGVLESPTGTGKTLCLLCATLAWRENFKDTISARKIAERLGGAEMFPNTPLSSWGTAATDAFYTDVPKIIYASRTHSQLAQVITELKSTSYRPKTCVLGSRDQLCINPEVMRQESVHIKVQELQHEKSTDKECVNSILDVEDLVKFGNKQRACPYYLSRSLKQQADIIFMPYNYLLDPKSRRAHNIELKGAVVIFDEAHNVEKMCEESTSFDLTPYDLASAINAVDKLLVEQAKDAVSEDFNAETLNSGLKMEITTIAKIKLQDFEIHFSLCVSLSPSSDTCTHSFIYELFERAHLNYDTKTVIFEALDQIISYLSGRQLVFFNGMTMPLGIILYLSVASAILYGWLLQVHIHQDTSHHKKKQNTDIWATSSSNKQGNILSYWCFSPGFSMQDLVNQSVRCIILTSGTLSPLSSFTSEMRIPFPVTLENSHVIQKDQIFVSIVDQGPDGVRLSSAFDRRFVPENMASLANMSRVVPHGLLVFFPSYPVMEKTLEFWRANGHASRIDTIKPMFIEPRGKGTFTEVIDGYYSKINDPVSKGGSFFAVCRGKASEGLDFADTFGRGVIITGLPFPPKLDPRVILKMQFLDDMCRKKVPGMKYLSGQVWYKQQAFRAVNQAIGRVIRHREDYGAIFLCDERFKNSGARDQLPSWLKPHLRQYDNFGYLVRDVTQFFRVAQKLVCFRSVITKFTEIVHVPSIKDEQTETAGMARFCIEYETDIQGSQRKRPAGLLDALEHSDQPNEEEAAVGEEKKIPITEDVSEEGKADKAKKFLAEMKKSLSQVNFDRIVQALQTYKRTDNIDVLLTDAADLLAGDANTHSLLRGFYQFIRPHHKKTFHEKCQELTGQGCGYKPDHSLSKEEKEALILRRAGDKHPVAAVTCSSSSSCSQLNTLQLNKGGQHLSHHGLKEPHTGSLATVQPTPKNKIHVAFVADVKKAIGAEKCSQLFVAIQNYKKTDNYETLVSTVVNLLTEKDDDFTLLVSDDMLIKHICLYWAGLMVSDDKCNLVPKTNKILLSVICFVFFLSSANIFCFCWHHLTLEDLSRFSKVDSEWRESGKTPLGIMLTCLSFLSWGLKGSNSD
uniref:Regulator of telomere elongation helicase 1 n=1 Tax=Myripristis murdjan TaxID=586833 RepID=A0A667WJ51_9TELE